MTIVVVFINRKIGKTGLIKKAK